MSNQAEELLPCPFCGGKAAFRWCGGVLLAECINCGTSKGDGGIEAVPMGDGREFHRAAAANWNRRPAPPSAGELEVHTICDYLQGKCHKCPRVIDTAYGRGMQGCYAIAEETIHKVRALRHPQAVKKGE